MGTLLEQIKFQWKSWLECSNKTCQKVAVGAVRDHDRDETNGECCVRSDDVARDILTKRTLVWWLSVELIPSRDTYVVGGVLVFDSNAMISNLVDYVHAVSTGEATIKALKEPLHFILEDSLGAVEDVEIRTSSKEIISWINVNTQAAWESRFIRN